MLAASVRSGLVETYHEGALAVCDPHGNLIAYSGDIDRPFFIRSASKPFQAFVSQESGADLSTLELAVASSSHRGHPVQIALVNQILAGGDLTEDDLRCPPAWPSDREAERRLVGSEGPRRIWHNCSGKHSGFLRACRGSGWTTADYLSPDHPLQMRVVELITEVGGYDPLPVGVDGCGAPVHRTTVRAMARMYAVLATDSRFENVYTAMHRYPSLIAGNGAADSTIATCLDAVAKGGAQGNLGVAVKAGYGMAVKTWDGLPQIPAVGMVAALDQMGLLTNTARERLEKVGRPVVRGGGEVVGAIEPRLELKMV